MRSILKDIFNGFASNPFITLATLTPSFESSLVATNGAPAARPILDPHTDSTWSQHNVASLRTLVVQVNSYAAALRSTDLGNDLEVAMEAVGDHLDRRRGVRPAINAAAARVHCESQLSNFSVDPSTITLAGSGTSIPITLTNHATLAPSWPTCTS